MGTPTKTVLVINCGSSSVKFAIIDPVTGESFISGLAEALNLPDARISYRFGSGKKTEVSLGANATHYDAIQFITDTVLKGQEDLLHSIIAVGHRIVQGGDLYSEPTLVDDSVEAGIEKCIPFAPLHNPAHLQGIRAARKIFKNVPHVTVFDTAFHQTMPDYAYRYAIPENLYTEHKIRKYGAHGTSHKYVAEVAAKWLKKDIADTNVITCHLGNGASVTAVKGGKCVDTSMGLTPLDGLVMGTRCGSLDPSVVFFMGKLGYSFDDCEKILNKQSGLLALYGKTSDWRGVTEGVEQGDEKAILAYKMFTYRLARFIASYYVPLQRVDALVFTGGIGENSKVMRTEVLKNLAFLGYRINEEMNDKARLGGEGVISMPDTPPVFVIPTNAELAIARAAAKFAK